MKKTCLLFLYISPIFFLSSCLDCERVSLSIDLVRKVGEVNYFNIVSNSKDEKTIKEDFRELIKKVYFDEYSTSDPDRITSKRLYRDNKQLNATVRFSFIYLDKVLKEFEIKKDKKGDYFIDVTKEVENYQISGNGRFVEVDSQKLFRWPKNGKEIKLEMKTKVFNELEKTRLLQYWQDWADSHIRD